MNSRPNVRFYERVNQGWCRFTLKPPVVREVKCQDWDGEFFMQKELEGGTIEFHEGGPCEEGYSYSVTVYRYCSDDNEDLRIVRENHSEYRDCDGRYSSYYEEAWDGKSMRVALDYEKDFDPWLEEGPRSPVIIDGKIVMLPDWRLVDEVRRDYSAEAMGY